MRYFKEDLAKKPERKVGDVVDQDGRRVKIVKVHPFGGGFQCETLDLKFMSPLCLPKGTK